MRRSNKLQNASLKARIGFRTVLALAIAVLVTSMASPQTIHFSTPARVANAQSSCPSNEIFKMTIPVPPASLNMLTFSAGSAVYFMSLEYYSIIPFPSPTGMPYANMSFTDGYTHNANYTVWTFHVKPGLKWSDGTNATAQDILASYGPKFGFNSTYDFPGLEYEVSNEYAINSSTMVFDLNSSDAAWATKLAWTYYIPVYPAEFVNSSGAASPNLGTDLSIGPFYVSNYVAGSTSMTLLRNPYYHPLPAMCEIDVNFVETLSLTATSLTSGATDFGPIEYTDASAVLKNTNMHLYDLKGLLMGNIQYNDSIYPYNVTAFRQALVYAINQSAIVSQVYNGYALPAYSAEGAVSPATSALFNPNLPQYSFNQTEALKLFASAGITKGSDGMLHFSNGSVVSLSLWTDTDNTEDPVGGGIITRNLQSLGFQVNLQTTSISNIIGDYSSNVSGIRNAMIFYTAPGTFFASAYDDILPAWDIYWIATTPSHSWLWPPSANDEYNSNFTAFTSTDNSTQQLQYLFNIQALNAQYLPTIALAYPDILYAYNTQRWTNWPSGNNSWFIMEAQVFNDTSLATLQPVSASTSTTTPTTSTQSTPTTTTTSNTTSPLTTTTQSTSSSTSTAGSGTTYLIVGVVVVVVVVIGAALALMRRKPATPAAST
jgi:peptide/nickel transport system substrate-binding protein